MAPEYLSESFQNRQRNVHSYATRNNDFIRLSSFRRNFGEITFRVKYC